MIATSCWPSSTLPMDMYFNPSACNSAANVPKFVDQSSAVPTQPFQPTSISSFRCAPAYNFDSVSTAPVFAPSTFPSSDFVSGIGMKRKKDPNDTEPSPRSKRRHYEERMSQRLSSMDLSGEGSPQSNSNSPLSITELLSEPLDDAVPMEDDTGPTVEHPEDSDDEAEPDSGGIRLSDELRRYMFDNRQGPIIEVPNPIGRELVLYRGPRSSLLDYRESSSSLTSEVDSASPITARISEVSSDSDDSDSDSRQNGTSDDAMMEDDSPRGQVSFPDNDSGSSGSRDSSPPTSGNGDSRGGSSSNGPASCSDFPNSDARSSSVSSSSSDGNRPFRTRQSTLIRDPPPSKGNDDEVPMDID